MLTLFITEAALGSILILPAVPVRAAGRLFFRFAAAQAATLIVLGLGLGWITRSGAPWSRSLFVLAVLLLIGASGLFHLNRLRPGFLALVASIPPALAAVVLDSWELIPLDSAGTGARLAWGGDAVSAGLVTGSVLISMVLGHYYLNIPGLSERYLERFALITMLAIGARALVLSLNINAHGAVLLPLVRMLLDMPGGEVSSGPMWGTGPDPFLLVLVLIQGLFGILVPLIFVFMAWRTARIASTQSATGILYVALIMVIMGELAGRYIVTLTRLPI